MKNTLLISLISASIALIAYAAIPQYEIDQYYVWDDATTASNALHYVNVESGWLPYKAPNGYRMDKWVEQVQYRASDGKACWPRIPTKILTAYGVSTNEQALFFLAYNPQIEQLTEDWFPLK